MASRVVCAAFRIKRSAMESREAAKVFGQVTVGRVGTRQEVLAEMPFPAPPRNILGEGLRTEI